MEGWVSTGVHLSVKRPQKNELRMYFAALRFVKVRPANETGL